MDAVGLAGRLQLWHDVHWLLVGKTMKAFPNPHRTDETGMTLRDYFAGLAMNAGLLNSSLPVSEEHAALHAKRAYQQADAMLKAREL
jgi:hypothetical protein